MSQLINLSNDFAGMVQFVHDTEMAMAFLKAVFLEASTPEASLHVSNIFLMAHQTLAREALFHMPGRTNSIAQNSALASRTPPSLTTELWKNHSKGLIIAVSIPSPASFKMQSDEANQTCNLLQIADFGLSVQDACIPESWRLTQLKIMW